jgi:hypothetical protein
VEYGKLKFLTEELSMQSETRKEYFPFGEPLRVVSQQDRAPKKLFVLGVCASAVHAKWFSPDGKLISHALAVASEPCVFWNGDTNEATQIISRIQIPQEAGYLQAADKQYNGPSGRALDELYLSPLGYSRNEVWLCDLVPYSYQNLNQTGAIERAYNPVKTAYNLPGVTIPKPPAIPADEKRREEILRELAESQAATIILLGDDPIQWFLSPVSGCSQQRLADFGKDTYGTTVTTTIAGKVYSVLPLVHPRQAAGLGPSTKEWQDIHRNWLSKLTRN